MGSRTLLPALALLAVVAASAAFLLSGHLTSQAVQNPTISLDMDTAGNSYDENTNSMAVGAIDNCLTSATANPATHTHPAHVIINNVEDLVAFQVRMNYIGDQLRPSVWNPTPFTDNITTQNVGFINLPLEAGVHRVVTPTQSIPPAAGAGQTAIVGAAYQATQTFPVSPDTPAKSPPDDTSYSAPTGGILGTLTLQVVGDETGQSSLFMNLDDGLPNAPGTKAVVFNGTGTSDINLLPSQLGDGYHGEGATCVPRPCTNNPCPLGVINHTFTNQTGQTASDLHVTFSGPLSATLNQNAPGCPTPTFTVASGVPSNVDVDWGVACVDPGESVIIEVESEPPANPQSFFWTISGTPISTPTPSPSPTSTPGPAGHDARLTRVSGVPKSVRLLPGEVVNDSGSVVVANQSAHSDTIGVYVDVMAPAAGGCTPNGRVFETTVALAAGAKTTLSVPVSYSCADPAAASGSSFTWVAVADHGADDLSSCPPGTLQGVSCFNALADDDQDPADNRLSRNGPKVIAQ